MSTEHDLAPSLDLSNFNIILACLGFFIVLLGLVSYIIQERLFLGDSFIALLVGIAFGPVAANFIRPTQYGNIDEITLAFTRLVIGIQLVLAGIQLPSLYVWHQKKSIAMLLLPIMTAKWVISALVVNLVFPVTYLEALVIGACVTPTDPVLSNAIVKGRYAEQHVSMSLRNIISAEAGANDGFGYPFLFLAVYLLKQRSHGAAFADWVVHTCIYEILLSVLYGIVVGLVARSTLKYALRRSWVHDEAYPLFFLALALIVIGTCGLIGTDDLLAAFAAGNAFSFSDFYRHEIAEDSLQHSIDMTLNWTIFVWLGATIPWTDMQAIDPGWRLIVVTISILIFGRLPVMVALYRFIPEVKTFKEAIFAGWFGPVGVGAIFYVQVAIPYFEDDPSYVQLHRHLKPVVYAMAISSIFVHGVTLPVMLAGTKARATLQGK